MQESKKIKAGQPIICLLMSFIPDQVFTTALQATHANHYYKKVLAEDHFLCLFYAVVTRSTSLREACKQIILPGNSLSYCGVKQIPKKSTLSDANNNRSHEFCQTL